VALSDDGTTLVVSALTEDSDLTGIYPEFPAATDNEDAPNSGAVYVFVRSTDEWELQAYIKAPNTEQDDLFGWDVSLSGDGSTLAVSSIADDSAATNSQDNSLSNSGAVFVYTRSDGVWALQSYLKASNADEDDSFGSALAINENGSYLAISAVGEAGTSGQPENNSKSLSGAVYVFARDSADAWSEVAYLKASNADSDDLFGQSISFDADASLLAVGAPREDRLIDGIVSVDAGTESLNTGAVYLFERSGSGVDSSWNQKSFYFKPSNASQNQQFGQAVSLSSSGTTLAVGAWGERSVAVGIGGNQDGENVQGAGAVYVFGRTANSDDWEQVNYVKPSDQQANLFFGAKLDLADDGRLLSVAGNGVRPDSFITGFSGYVYVY
jgi:trimeric autotransporter adhesin